MNFHNFLKKREHNFPQIFGEKSFLLGRVYSAYKPFHDSESKYGAIFNLEFCPIGNILVAACEKKSVCLFDALTTKPIHTIHGAHAENVNCITFLDDRIFASCSDDTTVALWDLRFLKSKVRSLHGHSNWVKNVEYSHKDNLLVTSGFDGSVFVWDINSHTEQGLTYQKVFHTSGLMRCRITPDGTKMVLCTTGGYLMILHDLDLTTLHKDLWGFRPNMYRLMQLGQQYIPQAAKFDHLFSKKQKKNRVEFVTDFPAGNDAEVILALQIHPKGCSFLSRNKSADEHSEWSCVHDINEEKEDSKAKKEYNNRKRKHNDSISNGRRAENSNVNDTSIDILPDRRCRSEVLRNSLNSTNTMRPDNAEPESRRSQQSFIPDIWAGEITLEERAIRQSRNRSDNSITSYNFVYAISSGILSVPHSYSPSSNHNTSTSATIDMESRSRNASESFDPSRPSTSSDRGTSNDDSPLNYARPDIDVSSSIKKLRWINKSKILQNAKKLMYYISESTSGKSFIKEPSFSSDGRIICSPNDMGIRFLAYDDSCSEYQQQNGYLQLDNEKRTPKKLTEIKNIKCHDDIVLCTKFSPRQQLLVTGCRSGQIVWQHPLL